MLIRSKETTNSHVNCVIQLEDGEEYNYNAILNACSHPSVPRYSSTTGNIPKHIGRYNVSVQIGRHPYGEVFAEMVNEYGKA